MESAEWHSLLFDHKSPNKRDYALDFSKCQVLETLRTKVRRTIMTLTAHLSNIESFIRLSQSISSSPSSTSNFLHPSQEELEAELQQHIQKIITQKGRLEMLLKSSGVTSKLVSFSLPFPLAPFPSARHHIENT